MDGRNRLKRASLALSASRGEAFHGLGVIRQEQQVGLVSPGRARGDQSCGPEVAGGTGGRSATFDELRGVKGGAAAVRTAVALATKRDRAPS